MSIQSQEQVTLLTDYDANSTYNTAYHTIYANIRFGYENNLVKQHAILLTTPTPYVGQAAVAANIAIAAAQSGTPTIVVDADLSTPTLQQRFGIEKSAGLSDLLTQSTLIQQDVASRLYSTFLPKLRVLCAGTAAGHDTNLLFSTNLQAVVEILHRILAETETEPSLVIFNGPAVLTSVDAALLSDAVDQTFLTIRVGRTTRKQARQAQEQLQRTHAKLTGVIMLDV